MERLFKVQHRDHLTSNAWKMMRAWKMVSEEPESCTKREQSMHCLASWQELWCICQSRGTLKSIWTHVQLWATAGWTYWPQKVILSISIRNISTSDPSSDLSTPVRKPQSETKRLFPGTGLPPQFLYIGESGMWQKKVVAGFDWLPPASLVDLKQEIYCSTVTSNVALAFELLIATPVTWTYGRMRGSIVNVGESLGSVCVSPDAW